MNYGTGIVAAAALLAAPGATAAEHPLTLGVRVNALHASGDMYGAGLSLGLRFRNGWIAVGTLDKFSFEPAALSAAVTVSPQLQTVVVGAAIGRQLPGRFEGLDWFWSMGVAAGLPQDGHHIDAIAIRSGTQVHLTSAVGGVLQLDPHWSLGAALRIERHYVDIRFNDTVSGERRRLSTLTPAGLYLSLNYRF